MQTYRLNTPEYYRAQAVACTRAADAAFGAEDHRKTMTALATRWRALADEAEIVRGREIVANLDRLRLEGDDSEQLRHAVELVHSCSATLVGSAAVRETFRKTVVWQGIVHIFTIEGNPQAKRAYAWSSQIEGTRRIATTLHTGLILSPVDAVRAALVADYKQSRAMQGIDIGRRN